MTGYGPPPRIDALLHAARRRLQAEGGDASDAEWLLSHVLAKPRGWLYAHVDEVMDPATAQRFDALLARRVLGEPVAYLTGYRGFWGMELQVSPDTLIPRPETELLVEVALRHLTAGSYCRIADLGTGSGAVALALARERPTAKVIATDASAAALAVARANASRLGIANIAFHQGDWLQPLVGQRFAMIVSNPPYIATDDPHLAQGDLRHEPAPALASGGDGLDAIRVIVRDAPTHLVAGGWLLLEHGWQQGDAVRALLAGAGFTAVATECDLEDRDRVSLGRLPA